MAKIIEMDKRQGFGLGTESKEAKVVPQPPVADLTRGMEQARYYFFAQDSGWLPTS